MPLLDAEVLAEGFDVGDEMRRSIVPELAGWEGLTAAALVEEDYAVDGWIEEACAFLVG